MNWEEIIQFWFEECVPQDWFRNHSNFDAKIRDRFSDVYWQAIRGETEDWRKHICGRLAEIIVLDQFARNIFRGKPQAFLYDPLALGLAQEMVRAGLDQELPQRKRYFVYMPYMHSESPLIHAKAVLLFQALGDAEGLKYEIAHKTIIDRFQRFPHRNEILGRCSTVDELEFLKSSKGF